MAVSEADVKAVIQTSLDVSPMITTAEVIVAEVLQGKGLSSALTDQITIYLAAHFVCLNEEYGGLRRSKMGDADESYRVPGDKDVGLALTRYGQQAMMMDITGSLAAVSANKGLKAAFEVITISNDREAYGFRGQ